MAQYIFGILILVLLFRGVLGYKELEKGIFIAAGIVIAIAGGVVEACFDVYDLNIWLQRFLLVLPLLIPMLIFKGRKGIIFGISFCAVDIIYEITSAIFGIELITIGPDFESIDNYIISGIICIIALLLVRCYLQSKNINLYTKINAISVLLFIPAFLIICLARIIAIYGGEISNEEAAFINGINITKGAVLGILAITLFIVLVILVYQKKEMKRLMVLKDKCLREQTEQYKMAMNKERELRRFRHDYNAHMTAISGLLANEEYVKLQEYIKSMGYFREKFNLVNSGNIITDAVFNQYKELCDKDNIEFEISGKLPENFNMAETDLCVLLSNLISNAYEAALKSEKERRIVSVEIRNSDEDIFIDVSNSVNGEVVFKNGLPVTDKPDRKNHGFGVENILEVVERNGGYIEWKQLDKGRFTAEIMLNAQGNI
ncbi:MAG: GHKL domain-containing protein [Anaerovoracaceae bacterium]|nr:GHKL domain-containing protein [Anaerovoracaceae bacterium]